MRGLEQPATIPQIPRPITSFSARLVGSVKAAVLVGGAGAAAAKAAPALAFRALAPAFLVPMVSGRRSFSATIWLYLYWDGVGGGAGDWSVLGLPLSFVCAVGHVLVFRGEKGAAAPRWRSAASPSPRPTPRGMHNSLGV